jgi:lupus La protein
MSEAEVASKPAEEPKPEAAEEQKPAEEAEQGTSETKGDVADAPAETSGKEAPKVLKTKGKIDFDNYRNNRKFDPSTRETSDDPSAIRKQVSCIHFPLLRKSKRQIH